LKITLDLPTLLLILYSFTFVEFLKNVNHQFFMTDSPSWALFIAGLIIWFTFNIIASKTNFSSKLLFAFVQAEQLHKLRRSM